MKALITGGAGFLGHHLAISLMHDGHDVMVLDDLSTGDASRLPKGVRFRELDITSPLAFRGLEPDRIYHLACPASPPKYQADPLRTLHTCYTGTLAALQCARNTGARLLFTSTSEVYGDPLEHPQREDYNGNVFIRGARSIYDNGKRIGEVLCDEYTKKYGIETRIARVFNTYGPGMSPDDGRVITNFIQQAREGKPLTVYGDGSQTRSFCYVDDTIRGLRLLMESDVTDPVNIGNQEEFTIEQLARTVADVMGIDACLDYLPLPQHDPKRRCPDTSKAKALLGWVPAVGLGDGLRQMIGH